MYKMTCKTCNNRWESEERNLRCKSCGANGKQTINFQYVPEGIPGSEPQMPKEPLPEGEVKEVKAENKIQFSANLSAEGAANTGES